MKNKSIETIRDRSGRQNIQREKTRETKENINEK